MKILGIFFHNEYTEKYIFCKVSKNREKPGRGPFIHTFRGHKLSFKEEICKIDSVVEADELQPLLKMYQVVFIK